MFYSYIGYKRIFADDSETIGILTHDLRCGHDDFDGVHDVFGTRDRFHRGQMACEENHISVRHTAGGRDAFLFFFRTEITNGTRRLDRMCGIRNCVRGEHRKRYAAHVQQNSNFRRRK